MRNDINVDTLLKSALSSTETPNLELVRKTKYKLIKEEPILKTTSIRRSFGAAAAAGMAFILIPVVAFAAWYFLKPSEVAERFGNTALSAAFESESAVNINESVTSGDYVFTLLAIVSGRDLTDHPIQGDNKLNSDRTYTVVAIQKADGSPMPSPQDDEYGNPSFYISPYVKGQKPWVVNAHSLDGGGADTVVDGVMYRILDCYNVTIFADRGVYVGIHTGMTPNNYVFLLDERTGEISANSEYDGVIFNLPIEPSLADPEKAQAFLDELLGDAEDAPTGTDDSAWIITDSDMADFYYETANGLPSN